ncbi:uncharacterized protein B0H18DRAFT_925256 [Fomitopsis serialis]|uniref:uncharacterized protein n=1 Tax=Fomitopsis serialis TaxID=139415 RepID=UPI0020084F6C|nr:uncharacterized protein B0H18DRAFT_925256 [Neoantrodia serialis]KAH9936996.1 hypothetical protein B0H18DRAFT_925256 [Neoantrodia serialis]
MAVQDLVELFEPQPSSTRKRPSSSRLQVDPVQHLDVPQGSAGSSEGHLTGTDASPAPPSFLAHPLLRRREPSQAEDDGEDAALLAHAQAPGERQDDALTSSSHSQYGYDYSVDVTDGLPMASGRSYTTSRVPFANTKVVPEAIQMSSLQRHDNVNDGLPRDSPRPSTSSGLRTGAPSSSTTAMSRLQRLSVSSTTTAVGRVQLGPHTPNTPIPLATVFSRKAPALYLPKLDDYIASLPAPSYVAIEQSKKGKAPTMAMFPPMQALADTKKTLADLEHNATVAPGWRNCDSIFSTLLSLTIGITGSSALASYYSVQGLFDTLQIFALILSTVVSSSNTFKDRWRELFLVKIPNILALNFASTTTESTVFLIICMIVSGLLLYYFYRATSQCTTIRVPEGQQSLEYPKHSWLILLVSFLLTVIYLPVSTIAMHILVWSNDLWVVPNPYTNSTSNPPTVAPLGPPDEYRAPLDFCWTTSMKLDAVNYAPVLVILATACIAGLTIWFPIRLFHTIKKVVPVVDRFTELGAPRSNSDMNREYQRLLNRDKNSLNFLYSGFRRGWGTYECVFLLAKLTTLLITAVIDPGNCLFRTLSSKWVAVARQIVLLLAMLVYFILQGIYAPFLNPINNASEWFSRLNYVLTSAVALGVALNIPGSSILNGVVLDIIYIVTYGLSFYFTIINMDITRRLVKRLARRIDFSIDMFSPRVDLSQSSPHTRRRIWQEALMTLFLTNPTTEIPKEQPMDFKEARDEEFPPYLTEFKGTPGERMVENLKILREVGSISYYKAVALIAGPDAALFRRLERDIQDHFIGPDCYWKPPDAPLPKCTHFFGNAWWIPFPPTLVIRYDDGPLRALQDLSQLEEYVAQNSSPHIRRKREMRLALRAMDGLVVMWPYDYVRNVGEDTGWCCCRKRYGAQAVIHYKTCTFRIKRRGTLPWEGVDLGSGFEVELTYAKGVTVDGSIIGLTDDLDLTQPLARFLTMNERLIAEHLVPLEMVLRSYRHHSRRECQWKADVLTYQFLAAVYNQPRLPADVVSVVQELERDTRVRELVSTSRPIFEVTYERWSGVSASELATWWYVYWDDLWRRNYNTISALQKHASDFDPHYPSSIAYTPLPRAALEAFLTQRGLLHKKAKWDDFFDAGLLNKMYLRMNDIVFHGSHGANVLHLGEDTSELDMEEVDMKTLMQPSTLGTGAGTDYDDVSIRARPYYRWEGILDDELRKTKPKHRPFLAKMAVWFGLSPFWRSGVQSKGLALDVRMENGRYVLLDGVETQTTVDDPDSFKGQSSAVHDV